MAVITVKKQKNLPKIKISAIDTMSIDFVIKERKGNTYKGKEIKTVIIQMVCDKKRKLMKKTYKCQLIDLNSKPK